ncbi:hypothetical protein [Lacisediminihabitans sp.]|jgi:peptidoglycan/LPS O-acetylase OafA/YrhL|uniref:hypothetical protein n=1 Tax=Lacisediminihabitans sp. TaxID=2787631 RepID=UPI002F95469B
MEMQRFASAGLLLVGFVNLVSSVAGGAGVLVTNGLGMPMSWLDGTPFDSYLWPGVILLAVVGGAQALAVLLQLRRSRFAYAAAAVAGFGMIIWIYVEVTIRPFFHWLQPTFFATGTVQVALALVALGALPARTQHNSGRGA